MLTTILRFDWQRGQEFQFVVALHLHFLIKMPKQCDVKDNYQQHDPPHLPPHHLSVLAKEYQQWFSIMVLIARYPACFPSLQQIFKFCRNQN